ncbi:MAG TPA: hypothetical protein VFR85_12765 [Anaeromyxobacteraceae bacterium]|nr:hypothetical protein [Anaeromyxobacteraceae bacterium]
MTYRNLLALVGALAVVPAWGQGKAPPARPAAAGLSDQQKLAQGDEHIVRMKQVLKEVTARLEEARAEKDIVRLNCVNEKLTQVKGLLKVSEQADIALQEAVARRDEAADAELQKIGIARAKVDQLRAEVEECIGQLAFAVDEKTTVEVEQPKDLPDQDLTNRPPPQPVVSRPPPASRYY